MRDRTAKRAFLGGSFGIDVDPLVIARGVSERVDAALVDVDPVAVPQVFADELFESVDAFNYACHGRNLAV